LPTVTAPPVSGFTLVRNAIRLDFPVEASIKSILPLCDEVVVNVGKSDDDTLDLIMGIDDPRIRIIESEWDFSGDYHVLADETQRAMNACRHSWGIYIQGDEVLHHDSIPVLRDAIARHDGNSAVEGLLLRYRHFYGTPDYLATSRGWYPYEVRVVRLGDKWGIHSYRDAQGFRVGTDERKIRVKRTEAWIHHYGWARPDPALVEKAKTHPRIYGGAVPEDLHTVRLAWQPGIGRYSGTHPETVTDWVAQRRGVFEDRVLPQEWSWQHLRHYASAMVERVTGRRPFEFRNYRVV
jgi:hypothetical protein